MSDSAFAPEVRGQAKAFSSLLARSVREFSRMKRTASNSRAGTSRSTEHRINGNLWFGGTDNEKVFGVLAFLSFFYLLGVVGAVEQDTMALGAGMVRMGIGLGCFWLFCELSGAFYPAPPRKRKSR